MKKPLHRTVVQAITGVLFAVLSMVLVNPNSAGAQASFGADVMSRYVWRGFDFGNAASIQPSLSYSAGGFEIGTWASYALDSESAGASEHDIWVGYTFALSEGSSFGVGVTDYYFPNAGPGFFNFENDGAGAHQIEPYVTYSGPESFPISLWASMFVHNEPDNSVYLEAAYPFSVGETDFSFTAGMTPTESAFYANPDGPAVTNLSISASREAPITESFSLPLSINYVLNPHQEVSYLVFGISL